MTRLPVLFLSHWSPMLALETVESDPYMATLERLRSRLPVPRAILSISAHFYGPYKWVDMSEHPETIHDFSGFPRELYDIRYPAPGFPEWAEFLREYVPDAHYEPIVRGLDHGTWTIFRHLFPDANIPIFSLSIDSRDSLSEQMELGRRLRILRENGILIVANGNIVHDLRSVDFGRSPDSPYPFARDFDASFRLALLRKDYPALLDPYALPGSERSVPTLEHYIPALIAVGASYPDESPEILYEWFELGSIGRTAFGFGID